MSFRGDEVDFVTTGPVAIVANIIVWITTGRMRPPEILGKIADYMDGLDRITMGDANGDQQSYGEFIIVLNMRTQTKATATKISTKTYSPGALQTKKTLFASE